jgi:hypothetical protein
MFEQVTGFINSLAGLITAMTTLLGGFTALITAWPKKESEGHSIMTKLLKLNRSAATVAALLLTISAGIFIGRLTAGSPDPIPIWKLPMNVRLTTAAWDFYNKKDYRAAIAKTQECIQEFQGSANREQAELKGQLAPVPPIGPNISEEDKATIFQRGLLNDVATCFYIQGRSSESLGLLEDAKRAYHQAETYPYARTWDPNGRLFWSPAQAAIDRLSMFR